MSFTQDQLDTLEKAIAAGTTQVRFADGHSVQYASLSDMLRVRDMMRRDLGVSATNSGRRYGKFTSGVA